MAEAMLPPAILTIFGITGDLSKRKLLPSVYYLAEDNRLPTNFKIVGITRRGMTVAEVIDAIRTSVHQQGRTCRSATLKKLEKRIIIVKMDLTSAPQYAKLKNQLDEIEAEQSVCLNRMFYLAMPSQVFIPVVHLLGEAGLNNGCVHGKAESRLLIEKPLGYDLNSATELINTISISFNEEQLYLIDHYLAKAAVQDLLAFRLSNTEFEPVWNRNHIKQIVITADESIGIEGRVIFYEQMGALRDVIQSHLFQLLSLVTMDLPKTASAGAIHAAKLKLLNSVEEPKISLRGQYQGYREEVDNADSTVETFAALKLFINSRKWQGVPIVLRTGKKLAVKSTEVRIVFKDKTKVLDLRTRVNQKDDYEQVIAGALLGDKALFVSRDEALSSWRIIEPVLRAWADNDTELKIYKAGSTGPSAYNKLIKL